MRSGELAICFLAAPDYIPTVQRGIVHGNTVLSQMLKPVARSFGAKTSKALLALRLSPELQARAEKLARKGSAGELTFAERSEYGEFVQASTLVGILQGQARQMLG